MKIEPLQNLVRDDDIEEWFVSDCISVPYLDGIKVEFVLENIEEDKSPEDFEEAIQQFLSLSVDDRSLADSYIYKVYSQFVDAVGEEEFEFKIKSESEIWNHIQVSEVRVSRRPYEDRDVYVQITANCDWEIEHGLQIVLRKGKILSRVSDQDGHLTTADAYALPEAQNTIIYNDDQELVQPSKPWWKFW